VKNFRSILLGISLFFFFLSPNFGFSVEKIIQRRIADVQFTHLGEWERSQGRGSSLLYCVRPDCMTKHKARKVFFSLLFPTRIFIFSSLHSTQADQHHQPLHPSSFLFKKHFFFQICAVSLRLYLSHSLIIAQQELLYFFFSKKLRAGFLFPKPHPFLSLYDS
jgi:hypothetical protein